MRIADILTEQEEEEEEELADTEKKRRRVILYNKSSSSSLPSLLSRWLSRKKSGPGRDFPVSDLPVLEPDRVATEETSSTGKHKDISFNIGMGIGLVFLLAKSASEVNKMIELRAQTEMLLKEVSAEFRNKDAIASSSESNNKISISPTRCCGDAASTRMTISMDVRDEPYDYEDTKHAAESGSQSYYETALGNTRSVSIDQMEAELEVELERLETNLEGETSSVHQCGVKLDNESDGESFSATYEEDDNNSQELYGVSAFELERRLHELLATRREEQIEELQSALECMGKKLLEKEMELKICRQDFASGP